MGIFFSSQLPVELTEQNFNELKKRRVGDCLPREFRPTNPPSLNILVMGLHHSGKSSLINTILRILNNEFGKPINEWASPGNVTTKMTHTTVMYEVFSSYLDEWSHIRLFDVKAPNIAEQDCIEKFQAFYEKVMSTGILPGEEETDHSDYIINSNLMVVTAEHIYNRDYLEVLKKLSTVMKKYNRSPIVILTGKARHSTDSIESEAKLKSIFNTPEVFIIENYTTPHAEDVPPKNIDTNNTVWWILNAAFIYAENIIKNRRKSK